MADREPLDPMTLALIASYRQVLLGLQEDLVSHYQARVPRMLRGVVSGLPEAVIERAAQRLARVHVVAFSHYVDLISGAMPATDTDEQDRAA